MKAITIWQPWASLIALGFKRYETRSWSTDYRGPIAIHSAKKWDDDLRDDAYVLLRQAGFDAEEADSMADRLPRGVIVGTARLVACHSTNNWKPPEDQEPFGDFGRNRFAWEFESIEQVQRPIEVSGKQGLWTWDEEVGR